MPHHIPEELSLAEKLKFVQKLMQTDDPRARGIFESIGAYLAYTVVLYAQIYDLEHLMLRPPACPRLKK